MSLAQVGDEACEGSWMFVLYPLSTCELVRHPKVSERVGFEVNEEFNIVVSSFLFFNLMLIFLFVVHSRSTVLLYSSARSPTPHPRPTAYISPISPPTA
jgi:hypothetical protein